MKIIGLSLLLLLFLSGCTPSIGVGLGGTAISGNTASTSEVYADSENGVHGSVGVGTDINL
ncbi:MAG: hypothetical protein P794_08140 [Epsilonproteobacteria bacterium (ex Lamellibrachia satsuma)]|nr:MAG: hypothetical protein P794_08140 [Epsilonproteobacteria bacterium (ex Lamellibrachia satsuma)]